ncbi:MAG: hypothetical protein Q9174_000751 [Haloplaca sp. 1 TL-2023]
MAKYPSRPAADTGPRSQHSLLDPNYTEAGYGPSLKHYLNVESHLNRDVVQQPSYSQAVNTSAFGSNSSSGMFPPSSEYEQSSFGFKQPHSSVPDRHPLPFELQRSRPDLSPSRRRASPAPLIPSATQHRANDPLSAQLASNSIELQGDRQQSSRHDGDGNSDLEDGELSEGTDDNPINPHLTSVSQVAHTNSSRVNPANIDSAMSNGQMRPLHRDLRSDLPETNTATARHARPEEKQRKMPAPNHEEANTVSNMLNPSRVKQGLTQPRQSQPKQSAKGLRDGAIHALRQLHAHKIDYPQMVGEDMDVSVLRELYTHLNTQLLKTPAVSGAAAPSKTHGKEHPKIVSSAPLVSGMLSESSRDTRPLSKIGVHPVASKSDTRKQDSARTGLPKQSLPTANTPQRQPNLGSGDSIAPKKIQPPAENHPLSSKIDNNEPLAKEDGVQMPSIAASVTDGKPDAAQPVADMTQQATASNVTHKTTMSKPAAKPVDRKDYIARLQAAKAGKSVQAATSSQASINTLPQKPPSPAPSAPMQKIELSHPLPNAPQSKAPPNVAASASNIPSKTTTGLSAAAEAKRREQTELARRKIEELKKRSKESKEVPAPTIQAPTLPSSQESSMVQKSSTEAHSNSAQPMFPGSRSPYNIPQHSYFPLNSGSFAIPGLFMSGPRSESDGVNIDVPPTKAHEVSRDMRDLDHMITEASTASASAVRPAPTEPDAALEPNELPAGRNEDLGKESTNDTEPSKPVNNPRKRPTAADFIEPIPVKIRRSHSGPIDRSVIIEVSDDDSEESEDENNQMKSDGNQRSTSAQEQDVGKSRSESSERPTTRPQSAWGGSNGISERSNGVPVQPNYNAQAVTQRKDSDEYRTKRDEIEAMNRRIAEMEKRRQAKQAIILATAQGSLGRPLPPSNTDEGKGIIQSSLDAPKLADVAPTPCSQEERILGGVQVDPTKLPEVSLALPQAMAVGESNELQLHPIAPERIPDSREAPQQEQAQGNGVVADPPLAEDGVEAIMSRLQTMQKEETDLQTLMQKKAEAKRALEKELEQLRQSSLLAAKDSEQVNPVSTEPQAPEDSDVTDPIKLPQATQDHQQSEISTPVVQAPDISHQEDPIAPQEAIPRQLTPRPVPATEVLTGQSLADGELAEDVMDISASEDEGIISENGHVNHADAAPMDSESSDEEPYEPPVVFAGVEDSPIIPTEVDQPDHGGENRSPLSDEGSNHSPLEIPTRPSERIQAAMIDAPIEIPSASHIQPLDDMNDSDDYEPPEPATPVDAAPVTADAAVLATASAIPSVSTNQAAQAKPRTSDPGVAGNEQLATDRAGEIARDAAKDGNTSDGTAYARFTPYESPLQLFHAYRYHPDFSSQVGSGYRSTTYSNAIDVQKPICPYEIGGRCNDASCDNQHFRSMSLSDDMILVQMGAVPEGLQADQRNNFVVGLRQIIQEIRGRKVKDFKTVASEIAAYRARFLGDGSKMLPL